MLCDSRSTVYALYKGDSFVDLGTESELSERRGVKASSIRWLASPANLKRSKNRNRMIAMRINDDGEDE